MMMLIAIALAAQAPGAEAAALGRRLAETGTLAALLPVVVQKDTEELVAQHGELSAAEQARLREVAAATAKAGIDRLMTATGNAYAEALSVEELRALVAFQETAAAKRYRDVQPQVIASSVAAMGSMDFKGDVRAAFCKETGKLCAGGAD